MSEEEISRCIRDIHDEDQRIRIEAVNMLGDTGDELCLKELRERLKFISREHQALIIAVGKLKRKLGVK